MTSRGKTKAESAAIAFKKDVKDEGYRSARKKTVKTTKQLRTSLQEDDLTTNRLVAHVIES